MMPGMDPRAMKQAMRKMGMKQEDIDAQGVVIYLPDRKLVFDSPSVQRIEMMGQVSFQVAGEYREEALAAPAVDEDSVRTVMEQAGCSEEEARSALEKTDGDIAEAIMSLE